MEHRGTRAQRNRRSGKAPSAPAKRTGPERDAEAKAPQPTPESGGGATRRQHEVRGAKRSSQVLKRVFASPAVTTASGILIASYLRLVFRTNRFTVEPVDAYDHVDANLPVIIAMWHGQHLMMPFIKRPYHEARVLVSRHRDGELNAVAAERLGIGTIRGSGDLGGRFLKKGGVPAFRAMLNALDKGANMALTADVPKIARRAGVGIVKLASLSGRPIVPVAMATSRCIVLKNWDRTTINLPFGRGAAVLGDWVRVPPEADSQMLEHSRCAVEESLNAATRRAYEIVGRRSDD